MPKPNWGGAASGAATGGGIGSVFGPVGTGIGAVGGGILGLLGFGGDKKVKSNKSSGQSNFYGQNNNISQLPTGTQQQQQFGSQDLIGLLQQMMGKGGGLNLANQYDQNLLGGGEGGAQGAFEQFSNPYWEQFQSKIAPQIAEKYAGRGALSSSAFGQALGGAVADLQSQLAQVFSGLQSNAAQRQQNQFQGLSNTGLGYSPFAYNEQEGSSGSLISNALTEFLKSDAGKAAGADIFKFFKDLF